MSRFWNTKENAGPTLWDVARVWDRDPRPLRPRNRQEPEIFPPFTRPLQLTEEDAEAVTTFWHREYKGSDWRFQANMEWVRGLLRNTTTIVLGVRDSRDLVGTIVARPLLKQGAIWLGTKAFPQAYMIEGLCIAEQWRGKHLAGWLIAWIDYVTNMNGPKPIFWCKEITSGIHGTDIALHTYAYVPVRSVLAQGTPRIPVAEIDPAAFQRMWAASSSHWVDSGSIVVSHIDMDGMRVFETVLHSRAYYVVIQDTQRRTDVGPIWEVAWCGYRESGILMPTNRRKEPFVTWKGVLEATCAFLREGLLFTTDAETHGGAHSGWDLPWVFGKSGYHATYMYGFMPPAFWSCTLHWVRREL